MMMPGHVQVYSIQTPSRCVLPGVEPKACTKVITPYGLKLSWLLPGPSGQQMAFNIHLKDNLLVWSKHARACTHVRARTHARTHAHILEGTRTRALSLSLSLSAPPLSSLFLCPLSLLPSPCLSFLLVGLSMPLFFNTDLSVVQSWCIYVLYFVWLDIVAQYW